MQKEPRYYYITYPVPIDSEDTPVHPSVFFDNKQAETQLPAYPKGFMPEWFSSGSFPEDEID